ncbi:hypothetical protein ABPG74_008801 [Tetrahymena malaccensis]
MSKSKILLTDKSNPWLNGFRDPVAKINAFNSSMDLIPLTRDGENRLLVGDFVTNKILGYKGINVEFQIEVNEQIIAVSSFYPEHSQFSGIPCLCFAVDGYIFIYQNNQPRYKFPLPKIEMHPKELEVWKQFQEGSKEVQLKMIDQWNKLRNEQNITLSSKALDVLIQTKAIKQQELIKQYLSGGVDMLSQVDTPTCLTKINTYQEGEAALSQLVVGTEYKKLYILDSSGMQIQKTYEIASVPASIICTGILQGDNRIIITTRDNQIQFIRNGQHEPIIIDLLSKPVQSILVNNLIVVGTMNETIACYNYKGSKQFSFKVNSGIVALESMQTGSAKNAQGYLVGLENQELRIYEGKQLVHILNIDGMIQGMKFGMFGREDGVLIMILKNKGIDIRILQRGFSFQSFMSQNALHNDEEERPLKIKRTNLFVEQTERERNNPVPIYRCLEKDLLKLRLKTAQSYLKVLEENQIGVNSGNINTSSNLRIQADIQGLGPVFKILMKIENLGNQSLQNLVMTYMYDQKLYKIVKPVNNIPFLLPHVSFPVSTEILSIDQNGASDQIKVIITEKNKQVPLIGAIIQIPLSEIRE